MQAGFEGVHVPYKGNAEVVMGLVSGQLQAGFLATPGVLQIVREGRLRALAILESLAHTACAGNRHHRGERLPWLRSWFLPGDVGAQGHSGTDSCRA